MSDDTLEKHRIMANPEPESRQLLPSVSTSAGEEVSRVVAPAEGLPLATGVIRRKTYHLVEFGSEDGDYEAGQEDRREVDADDPMMNLISSEIADHDDPFNPLHAPAIDIDHPCRLVESSTPGHFHLYIDVPMAFDQYVALLTMMVHAGIVEPGYLAAAERRGATFVRAPGIKKPEKS